MLSDGIQMAYHNIGKSIIIKHNIEHYELQKFKKEHFQANSVVVEDWIMDH